MNKRSSQVQLIIFLAPALLGTWVAIFLRSFKLFGSLVITIGIFGAVLLIFAKLTEKKRTKKIISWGPGEMSKKEKILYFSGYSILLVSMLVLAFHE